MSVQAESLEVLENANLPSMQARAIVRAIEIEIAGAKDVLATKHDVVLLRADLRQELTLLRSETSELATTLRSEMAGLRTEMAAMRTELRAEIKSENSASASSIVRQMYGAMLGQMAVLLGIAYFFVTQIANG